MLLQPPTEATKVSSLRMLFAAPRSKLFPQSCVLVPYGLFLRSPTYNSWAWRDWELCSDVRCSSMRYERAYWYKITSMAFRSALRWRHHFFAFHFGNRRALLDMWFVFFNIVVHFSKAISTSLRNAISGVWRHLFTRKRRVKHRHIKLLFDSL